MTELSGDGARRAPARRISDDDRQRVVDHLRDAAGRGLIDLEELGDRIESVSRAKTVFDLEPITGDLPVPLAATNPGHKVKHRRPLVMEDDEFRSHFTTYCMVMALLFVIWLASGAHFPWPFIVAAAWGIGLGSHYQVAAAHQRKRLARARSLGISLDELEHREREEAKAKRAARREAREKRKAQGMELARKINDQVQRQNAQIQDHVQRQNARMQEQLHRQQQGWHPPPPPAPTNPTAGTAPAGAPPAAAPRCYVAAMFVDVVGSTGLNEALGDDGWVRVRDRLRELLHECFEREGGHEVNSAGDGVLARFDHPTRAVCAAVEILRRLDAQRAEAGFAPSVRIGIHSGDVVAAGDDLIGSVVNLASRVTSAAEPDQITITEHVADHLDPSFHTEDRGIHSLRGVSRPRHLLSVRWR